MITVKGEGIKNKHIKAITDMKDRQTRQNINIIGILEREKSAK